jgi:hypothetical protein
MPMQDLSALRKAVVEREVPAAVFAACESLDGDTGALVLISRVADSRLQRSFAVSFQASTGRKT